MSRAALGVVLVVVGLFPGPVAESVTADPHLDPARLPDGCATCHAGHGEPDSPMLPRSQKALCLGCHGVSSGGAGGLARARATRVREGPFAHPVDERAYSSLEGQVTCTSCHSPHRGLPRGIEAESREGSSGGAHELVLCGACHGAAAGGFARPGSVADRISASSASYHPVEAPSGARSPSVRADLAGREIACTDCHGSDEPGARGVHASSVPHILVRPHAALDGEIESERVYALCYGCHDRESILRGDSFPEHRRHVVDQRVSCSTCHDPHGSPTGRALTRLTGDARDGRLLPSTRTGLLAFDSAGPGSGACHVSCHGHDHGPAAYGAAEVTGASSGAMTGWGSIPGHRRPTKPGLSGTPAPPGPPVRSRGVEP